MHLQVSEVRQAFSHSRDRWKQVRQGREGARGEGRRMRKSEDFLGGSREGGSRRERGGGSGKHLESENERMLAYVVAFEYFCACFLIFRVLVRE